MDYKIIIEESGSKIIIFEDLKFIGLQELLNTIDLFQIDLKDILHSIELVKNGQRKIVEIGSERAMIEMSMNNAEIYDLLEGIIDKEEVFPTINISLEELENVVLFWEQNRH
jgi:hypothetical protein